MNTRKQQVLNTIASHEQTLREYGHRLSCGEADRIDDEIKFLKEELSVLEAEEFFLCGVVSPSGSVCRNVVDVCPHHSW